MKKALVLVVYVSVMTSAATAQQWIGGQDWCNGKIGTFGLSYNAFTSYMAAPLGSAYLKCIFARSGQQTNFGHLYNDGVMQLNVIFEFGLPGTIESPAWDHSAYANFTASGSAEDYRSFTIDLSQFPNLFHEGLNLVAVETHNLNPSSDVGFDLRMDLVIPEVLADLQPIPEPSSLTMAMVVLLLLGWRVRSRSDQTQL